MSYNLPPEAEKTAKWLIEQYVAGKLRKGFLADRLAYDLFVFLDLDSERDLHPPDYVTEYAVRILAQEDYLYYLANSNSFHVREKLLDMLTEGKATPVGEFRVAMSTLLNERFDKGEMQELAYELGLEWDNIEGTTKQAKAQNIVATMIRQKQIARLLKVARYKRRQEWPDSPFDTNDN